MAVGIELIRSMYHSEPFRPFTLVLDDGRELTVQLREHLLIDPGAPRVCVAPQDGGVEFVDLANVTRVRMQTRRAPLRPASSS